MTATMLEERRSVPASAWIAVALLMPVALLNYLDRQMLASMQASVMADIPTLGQAENSQELWGFMLGQFKWVYAVFSLIGGYVADRFSRRLTICGSLFVWSGVTWWTGQVTTYDQLIWARSLMGLSEAFYIPAALALIADRHTQGTRSFAVGLHQTAIYLGVIAGGFGGYVAASPHLGWRSAFVACGVFGMLYAIPLVLFLRDDRTATAEAKERPGSPLASLRSLLTNPSFLLLVLYFTLPAMAAWIVRDWMPAILRNRFELGEGFAGVAATLPWQLAAIGGAAAGGYFSDRWSRTNRRSRIYVSAIGVGLIAPAIFGVGNSGMLWVAVLFLMLFGLGWGFFDCNNMPILSQIVRPQLRATGYGIMNFVSISCGGLADWGFGRLEDLKTPLNVSFGIFACVALLSIVTVLLIRPRPELATENPSA
ncbi:MAG TPA: MFS transporter [Pirellulaceae bacterium]|jgi:MFS family permease|nr:MFS transporter [Pirellulaceae bacterium]